MRRRVLASLAKSGYTAKDYMKFNPVWLFDGIENEGFGLHGTSKSWRNLADDSLVIPMVNFRVEDNAYKENSDGGFSANVSIEFPQTLQLIWSVDNPYSSGVLRFEGAEGSWIFNEYNGGGVNGYHLDGRAGAGVIYNGYVPGKKTCIMFIGAGERRDLYLLGEKRTSAGVVSSITKMSNKSTWGLWNLSHRYYAIRAFDRVLSQSELDEIAKIDKARFGLT